MFGEVGHQSGVYVIKNVETNHVYVGASCNILKRWKWHLSKLAGHRRHDNVALKESWGRHGAKAFTFDVLEYVEDPLLLPDRERFWINHYDATNPSYGFNTFPGQIGDWNKTHKARAQSRDNGISTAATPEAVSRLLDRNKSPEMRSLTASRNQTAEMRASTVARNHKARELGTLKGIPKSAEWKAKMSAATTLRWSKNSDGKAALAERNRTPEMRSASSARATQRWEKYRLLKAASKDEK